MASIFDDRDRCPACLSWVTDTGVTGFIKCYSCGLVAAKDRRTTVNYDAAYVADRYEKYPTTEKMSQLRARLVHCVIDLYENLPAGKQMIDQGNPRLLDVGYGNGSFIRQMIRRGWDACGCDVNPTRYEGVRSVELPTRPMASDERYKAITFFDALEHFEELDKVRRVADNTDWIFLSFPNAPEEYPQQAAAWKHYRPGEHHFSFRVLTLEKLFSYERHAARAVYTGSPEDSIRGKRVDGEPNILTVALKIEHLQ